MTDVDTLVARARAYAEKSGLALSTVSRRLLGNGVRLDELESGGSLRVDTLERARSLLDELEREAA